MENICDGQGSYGEVAEPLVKSEAMAELSKKLGLLECVRHVCQSVAIPLPGIVVVGEQSAGKSSLLENISGIQFPRAQNTCTRMPCVLAMLTDPAVETSYAIVSMDSSFEMAHRCKLSEVQGKIQDLTEKHAKSDAFISKSALYVRVVRKKGPQLSLIDLPGVTHNAEQMRDIHEVTVALVEEYIKPEEVVILCVVPAMSDFGNAEVIKLAKKYDPDGKRTLGVVTKCDDAARAEVSDVVEKVLMRRASDVQLKLGFHCVVNRSQKNIDEGMIQEELRKKEQHVFETSGHLNAVPPSCWGTMRLMEKIARIQENRVDECLPKIRESVRNKLVELRAQLRALPAQVETEADQYRVFNSVLKLVNNDLHRRVRAEFMSSDPGDKDFTIAPRVASMVQDYRNHLRSSNPKWLGQDMIDDVAETVENFAKGYTVENFIGPQIFISWIKRTFVEEGLLKEATDNLLEEVAEYLRKVVAHVVAIHANVNAVLSTRLIDKAFDVIDYQLETVQALCDALAESQQVTSTTHGGYMVKLTKFRRSWFQEAADGLKQIAVAVVGSSQPCESEDTQLTPEFQQLVEQAQKDPDKLAVLEICASLHIYTRFLIEGFVEMACKLIKYNLVEKLSEKLEERWRTDLAGSSLQELFPKDHDLAQRHADLTHKIEHLQEFKQQLSTLGVAPTPTQRTISRRGPAIRSEQADHVEGTETAMVDATSNQPAKVVETQPLPSRDSGTGSAALPCQAGAPEPIPNSKAASETAKVDSTSKQPTKVVEAQPPPSRDSGTGSAALPCQAGAPKTIPNSKDASETAKVDATSKQPTKVVEAQPPPSRDSGTGR